MVAQVIADNAAEIDSIWIHDFHLFLVPKYLRNLRSELKTGFFLHIPFPSSEVFRQLPSRKEILEGMLEADLIGFHDYAYLRHFCEAADTLLHKNSNMLFINYQGRKVSLGVFPISIDTEKFIVASVSTEVMEIYEKYRKEKKDSFLILGVDRLDYIKGVLIRLKAFRELLTSNESLRGNVTLLQIAIPTRLNVPQYMKLKLEMEQMVGEINGEFGKPDYVPVKYIYSSVSFNELVALYRLADSLLVTSRRDGMNLVSLEYIATQAPDNPGVVILSEFTGAASILSHAITINPWDIEGTASAIRHAINMTVEDRIKSHSPMLKFLRNYNVTDWAESFINTFASTDNRIPLKQTLFSFNNDQIPEEVIKLKSSKCLLLLDYDGTLTPIRKTPGEAVISSEVREIIIELLKKENIEVIIISGRDAGFLQTQFEGINISMACEHGSKFYNAKTREWTVMINSNINSWFPMAEKIMNDYSLRVPDSLVETKEYGIAWHYRLSPQRFAMYQAYKLKDELERGFANLPVTILPGNKVIEARAVEANKGYFVNWLLQTNDYSDYRVIAFGDDITDEEMFASVNRWGVSIKVGGESINANYMVNSPEDVLQFLKAMIL
jgi:trehalose 6-phosphate synthase/phosphatase